MSVTVLYVKKIILQDEWVEHFTYGHDLWRMPRLIDGSLAFLKGQ